MKQILWNVGTGLFLVAIGLLSLKLGVAAEPTETFAASFWQMVDLLIGVVLVGSGADRLQLFWWRRRCCHGEA